MPRKKKPKTISAKLIYFLNEAPSSDNLGEGLYYVGDEISGQMSEPKPEEAHELWVQLQFESSGDNDRDFDKALLMAWDRVDAAGLSVKAGPPVPDPNREGYYMDRS